MGGAGEQLNEGGVHTSLGWCKLRNFAIRGELSSSSSNRIAFARRAIPGSSRWRRT